MGRQIDLGLLDYATERQAEYLNAAHRLGSAAAAANEFGVHKSAVLRAIAAVERKAAAAGYAPGHFEHGVAPGFRMGKVTVQRGADGSIERTWERQSPDTSATLEIIRATVEAMAGEVVPAAPIKSPQHTLGNLCTLYTWTDYHVGMLAWRKEGGADWDVQIAEATGVGAMQAMVAGSPPSHTAIVNIQGDFAHYDGLQAVTPSSGHVLDADSRFGRVVEVSIRLIRQLVALALQKHEKVVLLICEGNHDLASSLWLRKLFAALYEAESRVAVPDSELPYYAIEWGRTMLGFHHGHLKKNAALPELFAAQFREMWGRCPKVYIHTGHRHHKEDREHSGCRVIQHPTLAARDAYAARGGWFSDRAITAMTFHREYGEVGTVTVTPEMLEAA